MPEYLQAEVFDLLQSNPQYLAFMLEETVDGFWYLDLENDSNEWYSPGFWSILGYEQSEVQIHSKLRRELIFPDDHVVARTRLKRHIHNQKTPYDLNTRYKHKKGHTVWVRERGIAIREGNPEQPTRMFGFCLSCVECFHIKTRMQAMQMQIEALAMQIEVAQMQKKTLQGKFAREKGISDNLKSQIARLKNT